VATGLRRGRTRKKMPNKGAANETDFSSRKAFNIQDVFDHDRLSVS